MGSSLNGATRLSFYSTCYPQHEKIKFDQRQQEQLKVQQEQQRVQQVKEIKKRLESEKDEQAKRLSVRNKECRRLRLSREEARNYLSAEEVIGNNNNSTNSKSTIIDIDSINVINETEVANSSQSNEIPKNCLICALESNEKNQIDTFNHVKDRRDIAAISLASSSAISAAIGVLTPVVLFVGFLFIGLLAVSASISGGKGTPDGGDILNAILSLIIHKTVIKILVISLIVAVVLLVISLCSLWGGTYKLSNMQTKIGSVILINNIFKYMLEKNKDDLTDCEIDTTALKNIINSNEIANKINNLISAHKAHILAVDQHLLAKKNITKDGDEFYELHQKLIISRAKTIDKEKEKLAKIANDLTDTVFKELLDAIPEEKHKNIINQMKDSYIKDRFENDYKQIIETKKQIPLWGGTHKL